MIECNLNKLNQEVDKFVLVHLLGMAVRHQETNVIALRVSLTP